MADDDTTTQTPSASGIEQCLRMLAQEALSIGMVHTVFVLQEALEICREEGYATRPGTDEPIKASGRKHARMN